MQDFSFEAKSLSGTGIEDAICTACGLQNPDSSNLPWVIESESFHWVSITAQNGSVSCKVTAYKSVNSDSDCYTVFVSNIKLDCR